MSKLTTSRNLFKFTEGDLGSGKSTTLRANRLVVPTRYGKLSIYARHLPSTLRMAIKIAEVAERHRGLASQAAALAMAEAWQPIDGVVAKGKGEQGWIVAYLDGKPVFRTVPTDQLDRIEAVAQGGFIGPAMMREIRSELRRQGSDLRVEHVAQAAVEMQMSAEMVRCAVIDRGVGARAGSYALQFAPLSTGRNLATALAAAADLIEANGIEGERLRRVRAARAGAEANRTAAAAPNKDAVESKEAEGAITLVQLTERLSELKASLRETSDRSRMVFLPRRPAFLAA